MSAPQPWAADIRRTRHIGDFIGWKDPDGYQKAFQRLLRDLAPGPAPKALAGVRLGFAQGLPPAAPETGLVWLAKAESERRPPLPPP